MMSTSKGQMSKFSDNLSGQMQALVTQTRKKKSLTRFMTLKPSWKTLLLKVAKWRGEQGGDGRGRIKSEIVSDRFNRVQTSSEQALQATPNNEQWF